ncbi:MAG: hypothetical protein GXP62_06585 [Oligoflexia bacterium]|nr:hypothetical protein [Oligoflexia bacterium]
MSFVNQVRHQAISVLSHVPEHLTDPSVWVGTLGILLLLAGRRIYKLAIIAPGIAAGVMVGMNLSQGESDGMRVAIIAALAIVAGFVLYSAERLAIAAVGAFVAVGMVDAIAPQFSSDPTPWPLELAAGVVGLLLFPSLYQRLLVVLTPAVGALCLAWALGRSQDLLLIVGLTLGGVILQLVMGRKDR